MKKFRVTVFVSWKRVCVDPQKRVILRALQDLDLNILEVGISKRFILVIQAANEADAKLAAEKVSDKLLANYNIEEYEVAEVKEVADKPAAT